MSSTLMSGTRPVPAQPVVANIVLQRIAQGSDADLAPYVELDPALAAAVLQAANAPHLRQSRRIATVRNAMVLLGTTSVEAIATSRTAALVMDADDVGWPPGYWARSIAAAASCEALAPFLGVSPDEAFTIGMLGHFGDLLLFRRDPARHQKVCDRARRPGVALLEEERQLFGTHHGEIGAEQLTRWLLPDRIVKAVRFHHTRPESFSDGLSRVAWGGHVLTEHLLGDVPPAVSTQGVLQVLGIDARADEVMATVNRRVERILAFTGGRR